MAVWEENTCGPTLQGDASGIVKKTIDFFMLFIEYHTSADQCYMSLRLLNLLPDKLVALKTCAAGHE